MTPQEQADLGLEFDRLSGYITGALEHAGGTHSLQDVKDRILDGRLQLWAGPHSAIVTEVLQHPRRRTLHFFLAGGNLAELEAMLPPVMEWGRSQDCSTVSLIGRAGWTRTFVAKQGWLPTAVMMEKTL